jgi:hypothetical protein
MRGQSSPEFPLPVLTVLVFQLASRKVSSTARAFQPAACARWQDAGSNSNTNRATTLALAAGGLFLGAGTVASCETNRKEIHVKDPMTFPVPDLEDQSEPRDPMTHYAKLAAKMESQEQSEQQQDVEHEPSARAQATSATEKTVIPSKYISDMSAEELRIEEATRKAKQHSGGIKVFSGNGNMALSMEIARHLGINLGKATVGRFADGEANVVIHENVRGKDCYVIQPTCPPVNDNMMELLLMVSTLRRASARRITVVIPYYGYARQDRKMQVSEP